MKLKPHIREAILAGDKNHEFGPDGFCLQCKTMHRTDFRQNNLCKKLMNPKAKRPCTT